MQTFLPYRTFEASARVLDRQRLGKQRVEAWQILNTLVRGPFVSTAPLKARPWYNHPATKMWREHEEALAVYGITICQEWINRGYKDTMQERFLDYLKSVVLPGSDLYPIIWGYVNNGEDDTVRACEFLVKCCPTWLGLESVHASHRSNLLRKDPEWYGKFGWKEKPDLPYVWPRVPEEKNHA